MLVSLLSVSLVGTISSWRYIIYHERFYDVISSYALGFPFITIPFILATASVKDRLQHWSDPASDVMALGVLRLIATFL